MTIFQKLKSSPNMRVVDRLGDIWKFEKNTFKCQLQGVNGAMTWVSMSVKLARYWLKDAFMTYEHKT